MSLAQRIILMNKSRATHFDPILPKFECFFYKNRLQSLVFRQLSKQLFICNLSLITHVCSWHFVLQLEKHAVKNTPWVHFVHIQLTHTVIISNNSVCSGQSIFVMDWIILKHNQSINQPMNKMTIIYQIPRPWGECVCFHAFANFINKVFHV